MLNVFYISFPATPTVPTFFATLDPCTLSFYYLHTLVLADRTHATVNGDLGAVRLLQTGSRPLRGTAPPEQLIKALHTCRNDV